MALESTLVPKNWRERGGGFRQPQEVAAAPAPADTGMRPVGFRNTGAIREQGERTAALAAGAASVGEPTSFRGGAGAPEPIAVMRGTATTFSPGRLPGHQFAEPEMATPLGAQQAWNRGMRGEAVAAGGKRGFTTPEATLDTQDGGFRSPGQTVAEIAATKEGPGKTAAGFGAGRYYDELAETAKATREKAEQGQRVSSFSKAYKDQFGPAPKEGTQAHEDYYDAMLHAREHGDKAGIERYVQTHQIRQFEPLFSQQNLDAHKLGFSMEELGQLKQQDPELYRRTVLMLGPKLAGAGAQPGQPGAAEENPLYVPNMLKRGFQSALSAGAGEVVP